MKIRNLQIKNFKRFTDLTIDLSNEPKLVLLIGTNGCGKSGVFDAFELISEYCSKKKEKTKERDYTYYRKNNEPALISLEFDNKQSSRVNVLQDRITAKGVSLSLANFYGRSAIRYLPRITRTVLGETINVASNPDKPDYYIDVDVRFENDIDIVIKQLVDQVFKGLYNNVEELEKIRVFLNNLNAAFTRVFGENPATSLKFMRPVTPADGETSQLIFAKGISEIPYDLLSSGEKEVVNILLNLFVRTPFYQDTIYYFDELDAHLNTALQYNLLKEITENWIPNNCQIWTATHSLGFIQYAKQSAEAAVIDFDNLNFDEPQILTHQQTSEVFDIAVPKQALPVLFKDKRLVFCENQNAALLNSLGMADTLFLGDIDKSTIMLRVEQENTIFGLIDRDYLSDNERETLQKKYPNIFILDYYCFENYVYHPQNLKELYADFDVEKYMQNITDEKNDLKNRIIQKLDNDRNSYIFYKKGFLNHKTEDFDAVKGMIESDDFEVFYKVFRMNNRGDICKIHNLNTEKLVVTEWFKNKIKTILSQ